MANRTRRAAPLDWSAMGRRVWRLVRSLGLRLYAAALIVLIAWLTWRAFRYLIVSLLVASPPPPQVVDLPLRMDESLLARRRESFTGIESVEHARSPLAHYHRAEGWFQPDRFNDCTRGGCHGPLPHSKRKEVRAFLNMHATSIHCGVCHFRTEQRPLELTWYGLKDGGPRAAPTILAAYDRLTSPDDRQAFARPTDRDQSDIVDLLRRAARQAGGLPALDELARHLAAVRAGSPAFARLVDAARASLPRYFRGEYGAKLALRQPTSGLPLLGHPDSAQAVQWFLREGERLSGAARDAALESVHPLRRTEPLTCSDCHSPGGGLVDFAAAGYPAARIEGLTRPAVFQMIEHISQGRPMYLPGFMAPGVPTTQPASSTLPRAGD